MRELINALNPKKTSVDIISYEPREDQLAIIEKSVAHFENNEKGLLIIPCGVGKTLIALWITQKLNFQSILIGVPNKLLLKQWEKNVCELFKDIPYLIVSGGVDTVNIKQFLGGNKRNCIVITTYSSAHKVNTATNDISFKFDIKINDEVHHLTSHNMILSHTTKNYVHMLHIPSLKQLSLTATLKQIDGTHNDDGIIVSNDNVEYFGKVIDRKCLLWAINENVICDYDIQSISADEETLENAFAQFRIIDESDKRLFLSAYTSLKSIFEGHTHHLLIYSNNKLNSLKLVMYINTLLANRYFMMPELYCSAYHSEMNSKSQKKIINNFENARFGIITCVYCLGEGWDFPLLDGVVFSENMSSNIRIVQSALRASRKNKNDVNKRTKIILPILLRDDWLENEQNLDLKKVKEIIYQMGLEDETISQKIKFFKIAVEVHDEKGIQRNKTETVAEFGEYDETITQKLRLKTVKRIAMNVTYEKAKKIISDKNIRSKDDYYELCETDNRLTKEPETVFKGQFENWIEYLNIKREYYDLETCMSKVKMNLLLHPDMKKSYLDLSTISKKMTEIDRLFPPNGLWVEYYNVIELKDIIVIENKKKRISAIV
jgi:superfamily II DNA or RNA helicase